jgi:hypothetical protein
MRVKESAVDGATQEQIAELLQIPQPTYAKYESANRQHGRLLPHDLVAPFCRACGCSVAWLISGVANTPLSEHARLPAADQDVGANPGAIIDSGRECKQPLVEIHAAARTSLAAMTCNNGK